MNLKDFEKFAPEIESLQRKGARLVRESVYPFLIVPLIDKEASFPVKAGAAHALLAKQQELIDELHSRINKLEQSVNNLAALVAKENPQ